MSNMSGLHVQTDQTKPEIKELVYEQVSINNSMKLVYLVILLLKLNWKKNNENADK